MHYAVLDNNLDKTMCARFINVGNLKVHLTLVVILVKGGGSILPTSTRMHSVPYALLGNNLDKTMCARFINDGNLKVHLTLVVIYW